MNTHLNLNSLNNKYLQSPEAFHDFIDQLNIGVGVYNSNAIPIDCNSAAFKLLGLSKEQFMGNSAMDPYWKVTHADGSKFETYDFPIIEVITNYKPILGIIMGVSRPLLNDKMWLEVNTHPILNSSNSVEHVFCTYKDVTASYQEDW